MVPASWSPLGQVYVVSGEVFPPPHGVTFAFVVSLPQSRPFPRSCPSPSVVVELRLWAVVHGKVLGGRHLLPHLYKRVHLQVEGLRDHPVFLSDVARRSSLASAPGALQRRGPRPQQRRPGRSHPARLAHPALRGPAEQEAPRVLQGPAEPRPEHPALLPGPPLLQPCTPTGTPSRATQKWTPRSKPRPLPFRGTTPRRTGTTPKRTARPRPSSTSSTSPRTRPRPSSSGAPRTPPPKQTCDGHATKGQRDPETDEALNDILDWEAPPPQPQRPPDRPGTKEEQTQSKRELREPRESLPLEGAQRDSQAAQQHSKAGYPIDPEFEWMGRNRSTKDDNRTNQEKTPLPGNTRVAEPRNQLNSKAADSCNRRKTKCRPQFWGYLKDEGGQGNRVIRFFVLCNRVVSNYIYSCIIATYIYTLRTKSPIPEV